MKRHLLLTITLLFGLFLNLQAQITTTNVVTNTGVEEDVYYSDCEGEEEKEDFIDVFTSSRKRREEPLRIYPNPTTEYISVTDNSKVAYLYVYNIIGRRVKSFPVFEEGQYSLRDLPDGMYLIGMVDAQGRILKTVRTSKSVPRP